LVRSILRETVVDGALCAAVPGDVISFLLSVIMVVVMFVRHFFFEAAGEGEEEERKKLVLDYVLEYFLF
jgi:hypothetical protein